MEDLVGLAVRVGVHGLEVGDGLADDFLPVFLLVMRLELEIISNHRRSTIQRVPHIVPLQHNRILVSLSRAARLVHLERHFFHLGALHVPRRQLTLSLYVESLHFHGDKSALIFAEST